MHTHTVLYHSLHQIHFQLLLVSSYIKLINNYIILKNIIKIVPVTIISTELTEVKQVEHRGKKGGARGAVTPIVMCTLIFLCS